MNKILIPLSTVLLIIIPILAYGDTDFNATNILDKEGNITPEYAQQLAEDNIVWSMNHDYKQYSLNAHQIDKWTDRINLIFDLS